MNILIVFGGLLEHLWLGFPLSRLQEGVVKAFLEWAAAEASLDDEEHDIHRPLVCAAIVDDFFSPNTDLGRMLSADWVVQLESSMKEAFSLLKQLKDTGAISVFDLRALLDRFTQMISANCTSEYPAVSDAIFNYCRGGGCEKDFGMVYAAIQEILVCCLTSIELCFG